MREEVTAGGGGTPVVWEGPTNRGRVVGWSRGPVNAGFM